MRILALGLSVLVSACSATLQDFSPIPQRPTPKHELRLISDNFTLTEKAQEQLKRTQSILLGQEQSDAQFSLILSAEQRTAESALPHLIGRLGKIKVKPELKVSYQLINKSGEKLTEGTQSFTGATQEVLSPGAQQGGEKLNEVLLEQALSEIIPIIEHELRLTPIAKDVISQEGLGQVTIAASQSQGFIVGDIFRSPGTGSLLKLTRFTSHPFPKAYLVLQQGELPQAGETVELVQ